MDLPRMDPPRRRPVPIRTQASFTDQSTLAAPDPQPMMSLRQARSATNLRAAHQSLETGITDNADDIPVDFVVDGLPTPPILSRATTHDIRRVKSSSDLSPSTEQQVPTKPQSGSKWNTAVGEAQYFAGGLISRPAESTRHYSIIRHSHALIWYHGASTSVSITILSDKELPPERSVWLQQKGYSGSVGMSLKALVGTTGSWLDVTPATRASREDLPDVDERGIQRDMRRFSKKASGRQKTHVPRETHVVRIPAAATDGYFRLVLCADAEGKKTLCGCPVFRVASTSTDVSVIRGASIRTMPLEVGVKVGTSVAQQFAKRYTGPAAMVAESRAAKAVSHKAVQKVVSGNAVKTAAKMGKTVVQTTHADEAVMNSWKKRQVGRYDPVTLENSVSIIGSETGPDEPFPLWLDGKVVRATGRSTGELGIPTANLRGVRDDIKMRWRGVYAAWASIVPTKGAEELSQDWHEAVVSVGPLRHSPPEVVMKNRVTVHFIHDFEQSTFYDMKVRVVLMGHLHPPLARDADSTTVVEQHAEDTLTILASLGRERWSMESVMKKQKDMSGRLDGMTDSVQGRVDRIPLHWAGVRSESGAMRDKVYGNGGIWVQR